PPDPRRSIEERDGDAVYVSSYDLAYPNAGGAIADHVATLASELVVGVDPGPLVADIEAGRLATALRRVDILSLNRRELDALGGLPPVMSLVRSEATVGV